MLKQFLIEWLLKQNQKKMQVNPDYNVETYLKKIPEYFDPVKAEKKKLTVIYEFHDSGENDGAWTVSIADGKCELTKGAAEKYDSLLYMTADTYRRILMGLLDFERLTYSVGAIRYFGSTLGHRELNAYITLPKKAGIAAL